MSKEEELYRENSELGGAGRRVLKPRDNGIASERVGANVSRPKRTRLAASDIKVGLIVDNHGVDLRGGSADRAAYNHMRERN